MITFVFGRLDSLDKPSKFNRARNKAEKIISVNYKRQAGRLEVKWEVSKNSKARPFISGQNDFDFFFTLVK